MKVFEEEKFKSYNVEHKPYGFESLIVMGSKNE